jgi:serine/threonine protein kinase
MVQYWVMENLQKFGRYTAVKMLGQGAMGKVYLALDPVLERKVALKVISIDAKVDAVTRDDYLRRFSFEAKASAKLTHPSIVAVYDAGEENDVPWIAFEFVQGETLERIISLKGRLPIGRALAFARDIASALRHAHGWSIIHRDIKPANILVESATGIAKLADFGIVKAPWAVMAHDENTLGSPGYMSPEQFDGVELDERADLFCLGVVMYQMITGMHPFLRETMAATMFATCNNEFIPLRDLVDAVPPSLDWAVRRCCAADRDKRLRSADELIEMLNKAGELPGVPPAVSGTSMKTGNIGSIDRSKSVFVDLISRKATDFMATLSVFSHGLCTKASAIILKTPLAAHFTNKRVSTPTVFAAAFLAIVIIPIVAMLLIAGGRTSLPSADSPEGRLIVECGTALRENNRALAMTTIDRLSTVYPLHPLAEILIARVHIRNGMYEQAKSRLLHVQMSKEGKKILTKELEPVLDDISRQLKAGVAPPDLVDIVRYVLLAGKHRAVRSWARSPSYWLRWNAADILRVSNVDVDVTSLYILDLSCQDKVEIRLRAVSKLSEIGTSRARAALEEAQARDGSDLAVAQEAKKVLEENKQSSKN